jgi:hypothetical protein
MKSLIAVAALLLAAPSALADEPIAQPKWSSATPPPRWQRVGLVPVLFVNPADIPIFCSPIGTPPKGSYIVACTAQVQGHWVVVMPNPCVIANVDWYAQVQCHETAHLLGGWRHEAE